MRFGKLICWALRSHKWRRLRKQERVALQDAREFSPQYRLCDRCGATRIAAKRKTKEAV